ncbi:MAG: nucleoside-diphosphate kinase [Bacteroidetes bacterium]|nr:nucleoside-diphosphate kinase [Bacteroidota bacterium]MDI6779310.1 nucleoside-diphosphate kinase [Bacteroidota bacterium]
MERTLAILKPDCVRKNLTGQVIAQIEKAGFKILGIKKIRLTKDTAGAFYAVHKGRAFYEGLVEFISSGPCVPIALEKENAIADFRALIGATDPAEAAPGTVRKDFADNKGENIVHGSDSAENGKLEVGFFFSEKELIELI